MTEFYPPSPDQEQPLRVPALLQMLGRTATRSYAGLRSARNKPPTLFRLLEEDVAHSPQPLHPDISAVAKSIQGVLAEHSISTPEQFSFSSKLMRSVRMIHFTDQFADSNQAFFDYNNMRNLKERFVDTAQQQRHPLGFDQQLDIALDLADDDIMQALTTLWFASRQYGRWLDSVSIYNLPDLTQEETLTEMKEWRSSILACKDAGDKDFQDTAGDSYYTWTHVLARVMYGSGSSVSDRLGKYVFERGTDIMHAGVHTFTKQSVPSNHRPAAAYGNRIGDVILDAIEKK